MVCAGVPSELHSAGTEATRSCIGLSASSRSHGWSGASIHPEGLARVSAAHPFPFRSVQARTPRPTQYPQDLPASQTHSPAIIVGLCRIATSLWPYFVASPQRVPVYRYRRRGRAVVIFIYITSPASKIAATWATSRGRALRRMPGFVVGEAAPKWSFIVHGSSPSI